MNDDHGLRIFFTGSEYEVWYGVTDDDNNVINAHIIGLGPTREAAVADAVREIEAVEALLQSPPGVVPEFDVSAQPRPAVAT